MKTIKTLFATSLLLGATLISKNQETSSQPTFSEKEIINVSILNNDENEHIKWCLEKTISVAKCFKLNCTDEFRAVETNLLRAKGKKTYDKNKNSKDAFVVYLKEAMISANKLQKLIDEAKPQ